MCTWSDPSRSCADVRDAARLVRKFFEPEAISPDRHDVADIVFNNLTICHGVAYYRPS